MGKEECGMDDKSRIRGGRGGCLGAKAKREDDGLGLSMIKASPTKASTFWEVPQHLTLAVAVPVAGAGRTTCPTTSDRYRNLRSAKKDTHLSLGE